MFAWELFIYTVGACLIWSGSTSWAIWYLSLKNPPKNETVRAKKLFLGCKLEGDLKKNSFTQILFISKTFKINFMSKGTDLRSMSPFPLLKLHIKFLSLGKPHFWSILGGCMICFFRLPYNSHFRCKFLFQVIKLKKITKETYSENLKTVPLAVSSIFHI